MKKSILSVITVYALTAFPLTEHEYIDSVSCLQAQEEKDPFAPLARLSSLSGFAVGPNAKPMTSEAHILRPFMSDGCSSSPDGLPFTKKSEVWVDCCIQHDTAYWIGGTKRDKEKADDNLKKCITGKGYAKFGSAYEFFVKNFGGPKTSQTYRWGYGWNYQRDFQAISPDEENQIRILYGVPHEKFSELIMAKSFYLRRMCNTYDPVFFATSEQEKIVYETLNLKLLQRDVIIWAQWGYFNTEKREFLVKLESCPAVIKFVFYENHHDPIIINRCANLD